MKAAPSEALREHDHGPPDEMAHGEAAEGAARSYLTVRPVV